MLRWRWVVHHGDDSIIIAVIVIHRQVHNLRFRLRCIRRRALHLNHRRRRGRRNAWHRRRRPAIPIG